MINYNVNRLIQKDGLPYRELTKRIGISYRTLALLAKAKTHNEIVISTVIIDKLCNYFKCRVEDVIVFKNDRSDKKKVGEGDRTSG